MQKYIVNIIKKVFDPEDDNAFNIELFDVIQLYSKQESKRKNKKKAQPFEDKTSFLKAEILKKKISWQEGCCNLELNRINCLFQSMIQIKNIDLYKELKIDFQGEVSYDAGGIIREWFTIILQDLEGESLNLFKVANSIDFSYTINPFLKHSQSTLDYFYFIGQLIGKALLDNLTINVCFNKLIYKIILDEPIGFDDMIFIDNQLYHSWMNLKNNSDIQSMGLYYVINEKDSNGKLHTFDLIKDGRDIPVTNIDDYINKRIQFMIGSILIYVQEIQRALFELLSKDVISAFTADEFELILNGRPFIDIEEWKGYTEYKAPLSETHTVIQWFWNALTNLSQKQLSNMLQFCTGSARVPIGGFADLESNRGTISHFTIIPIDYNPNNVNYIKAHTCFNRIEIPLFTSESALLDAIEFIANTQIFGFGID